MNVGDVDLDGRQRDRVNGVEDRDRRMSVGGRIDDDADGARPPRFMEPVDDIALVVRLAELQPQPVTRGSAAA